MKHTPWHFLTIDKLFSKAVVPTYITSSCVDDSIPSLIITWYFQIFDNLMSIQWYTVAILTFIVLINSLCTCLSFMSSLSSTRFTYVWIFHLDFSSSPVVGSSISALMFPVLSTPVLCSLVIWYINSYISISSLGFFWLFLTFSCEFWDKLINFLKKLC